MAQRTNRSDYGLSAGSTINLADTANNSNSVFQTKLVGTGTVGSTLADVTSWGDPCIRFVQNSGSTSNSVGYVWSGFSTSDFGTIADFEYAPGATPTNTSGLISLQDSSGVGMLTVYGTSSTKLALFNAAGTNIWTSTNTLPASGRIKVGLVAQPGSTSSNGSAKLAYWTSNFNGTPTEEIVFSANANTGTVAYGRVAYGKPLGSAWANNHRMTNFKMDDAASFTYPVLATNVAPVSNAGANKIVAVGSTATLNGTDSDSDGTVASRLWTYMDAVPLGATAPTTGATNVANLTVTPSVPGKFRYKYVVVDDKGVSSPDSFAYVFGTSGTAKGAAITGTTEFVTVGGGSLVANVGDSNSATGISYPPGATAIKTIKYRLTPLPVLTTLNIPISRKLAQSGSGTLTVKLIQGTNTRFTWTNIISDTILNTLTLTHLNGTGDLSTITDWTELDLEFSWGP